MNLCSSPKILYHETSVNSCTPATFLIKSLEDCLWESDFSPDFSVLQMRRAVGHDQLSKQKGFCVKKILTKLRKEKRGKAPMTIKEEDSLLLEGFHCPVFLLFPLCSVWKI